MEDVHISEPSRRNKMKSSLLLSCFFQNKPSEDDDDDVDVQSKEPGMIRSLSLGTKSRSLHPHHPPSPRSPTPSHSHHNLLGPELKERCRSFITRNKSHHHSSRHHPSRRHSGDFQYDALSYSLNFEEPGMHDDSFADDFVQRSFSARLQASSGRLAPTSSPKKPSSTEITAC